MTYTEVAIETKRERADKIAARLNGSAFTGQRYSVEDGIVAGTFAVVLIDGETVRPVVPIGRMPRERGTRVADFAGERTFKRATTRHRTVR